MSSCYNRMKIVVKLIVSKRFSLITTVLWNTIQKWCQNRVVFRLINFKPLTERTNSLITASLPYQKCIFFISVLNLGYSFMLGEAWMVTYYYPPCGLCSFLSSNLVLIGSQRNTISLLGILNIVCMLNLSYSFMLGEAWMVTRYYSLRVLLVVIYAWEAWIRTYIEYYLPHGSFLCPSFFIQSGFQWFSKKYNFIVSHVRLCISMLRLSYPFMLGEAWMVTSYHSLRVLLVVIYAWEAWIRTYIEYYLPYGP